MQETNFDRLLHRYLHNELTPREKAKFTAWLDLLEKENTTDLEMTDDAKEKLFQKISSNMDTVEDVLALYPRRPFVKRLFARQWVQIAASVVILLTVSLALWNVVGNSGHDSISSDGKEKMILNDGTIVWIHDGSKFTYYEKDGDRFASLNGEALFEVARDPNSVFTITCGNINVKVLGTSFTLKTNDEQIELNVLTGKVNLTSNMDNKGVYVTPNEKVIYSADGSVERMTLTSNEISEMTADTEYNMEFRSATMDKVIESIAMKFDVTITVINKDLNKCHVSADFTDHSLESTLSILSELLDVNYSINGKRVELSGSGC